MASIIREFNPALSSIKSPQSKCTIVIHNYHLNGKSQEIRGAPISDTIDDSGGTVEEVDNFGRLVADDQGEGKRRVYPPPLPPKHRVPPKDLSTFTTRSAGVELPEQDDDSYEELYKHLAVAFSNILKTTGVKLISNLIDLSGKVLLCIEDLVQAVALICKVSMYDVKIEYEDNEAACCGLCGCLGCSKANPIKSIVSIKIGNYDFATKYNKQYNILRSTFNVSLNTVIVNPLIQ